MGGLLKGRGEGNAEAASGDEKGKKKGVMARYRDCSACAQGDIRQRQQREYTASGQLTMMCLTVAGLSDGSITARRGWPWRLLAYQQEAAGKV